MDEIYTVTALLIEIFASVISKAAAEVIHTVETMIDL